jgi:hypothetical protein
MVVTTFFNKAVFVAMVVSIIYAWISGSIEIFKINK